jgi:cytochrome bd-type quinol oxidase subunit 2
MDIIRNNYDIVITGLLLLLIIVYIKLCSITTYQTDNNQLSDYQKKILFITNVTSIILSSCLVIYEVGFISKNYNTVNVRIMELIFIFLLICLAYYANIFRENQNDRLCKIASGLWPLLGSLGIIVILNINAIYSHYNHINFNINNFDNCLITKFKI